MKALEGIHLSLVERGYEPISSMSGVKKDFWYRRAGQEPDIENLLFLEYKPSVKAYSVHAGVVSISVRNLLKRELPLIRTFLGSALQENVALLNSPCWNLYDAGRALRWRSVYVVPDPKLREEWPILIEQLFRDFLEPIFLTVRDVEGVRAVLCRNDPPFEWMVSPAVLRAAEVIALSCVAGLGLEEILSNMARFEDEIARKLAKDKTVSEFIHTMVATSKGAVSRD